MAPAADTELTQAVGIAHNLEWYKPNCNVVPVSAMSGVILLGYVQRGHVVFAQNVCLWMLVAAYYPDRVIIHCCSWIDDGHIQYSK